MTPGPTPLENNVMIRADLHVHSKASRRPSEWFLQKAGASESYTDFHTLYHCAKEAGMDFVTITDHNTIEGACELVQAYPKDTFISVETTTYFPENNCKIHLLLYDISPEQFSRIQVLRRNIYKLRNYVRDNDIACSVAHGFYSINNRLDLDTLEKLILLFDIFEGLNGARGRDGNETWQNILMHLTPEHIEVMVGRHGIDPISTTPWDKGFTGGSDDHAGLFIGHTATISDGPHTRQGFIQRIKEKKTRCWGRCNDYKSFAFSIYKIFCDFSVHTGKTAPGGIIQFINTIVFEEKQSRLKRWITFRKVKKRAQLKDKILLTFFEDVYNWSHDSHLDVDTKMNNIYHSMGLLLDEFFKLLLSSLEEDLLQGDIGRLMKNLLITLPAFFISIPFFSSLKHLSHDRVLLAELGQRYNGHKDIQPHNTLWFTDTFNDLNGVSITLERFCLESAKRDLNLTFVTCRGTDSLTADFPTNLMVLPSIHTITPHFYNSYSMNFPSLLSSMAQIYQCCPHRIIVSTPGPVGILGMMMAKILNIECVTIYHTDFAAQAASIFQDEALTGFIESAINRFYAFSTQIKVPTLEYMGILQRQGYPSEKMSLFKRGMTVNPMNKDTQWKKRFKETHGILPGTTLLWAGRVSRDKNINFLMQAYIAARKTYEDINLILCGDGPDLTELTKHFSSLDRVHFMGRVNSRVLQQFYDIADLFVFPSITDTFGMVILEAQASGVPALVSNIGGPQEIILDGETGHMLGVDNIDPWVEQILRFHHMRVHHPQDFHAIRNRCHEHIRHTCHWGSALADIMGEPIDEYPHTDGKELEMLDMAGQYHGAFFPELQSSSPGMGVGT
ncbi:glycosyltransferase [Desulfocicer niacini]